MRKRSRRPTPFDGLPGWGNRLNRALYPIMGPASVGIDGPEPPPLDPSQARCPLCQGLLSVHRFERSDDSRVPTRLICP